MNRNETSQALITLCDCPYLQMVQGTFFIINASFFQKKHWKNYSSYPYIVKGNLDELGSKFIIKLEKPNLYVYYEVKQLLITDYFSRHILHAYKTVPKSFEYDYILEIYYLGSKKCLIHSTFTYDSKIYISEREIKEEMIRRNALFKNIESFIVNDELMKMFHTNIYINCKLDLIWKILLNFKMINKHTNIIFEEIDYSEKFLEQGHFVSFSYKNGNSVIKKIAKITKCQMNNKECILEFVFGKEKKKNSEYNDRDKIINSDKFIYRLKEEENEPFLSKVSIIIYGDNNDCTMYIFYFFNEPLKSSQLLRNTLKKNKAIQKLKNIIEHFNSKLLLNNDDNITNINKNIALNNNKDNVVHNNNKLDNIKNKNNNN